MNFRTRFSTVVVMSIAGMFFSRFEMRFLIRIKMQVVNDAVFGSIFMTFLKGFQCTKKSTTHRAVFTPFLQLHVFFFMKNSKKWFALRAWNKSACTKLRIIDYQYCALHYQKLKNHFNRKASSTVNLYSQQHTKSKQALKIENVISFVKRKTSKISLFCANAPP